MRIQAGKRLKAAANRINARSRIAIGQVFLLVGVLWLAIAMGLVPSERQAVLTGRAKICEEIAVFGSALVERNDIPTLDAALRAVAARNPDILSLGLRKENGTLLIQTGNHASEWANASDAAVDSRFLVPISVNDKSWGKVEVRFKSTEAARHRRLAPLAAGEAYRLYRLGDDGRFPALSSQNAPAPRPVKGRPAARALGAGYACRGTARRRAAASGSCWPTRPSPPSSAARAMKCLARAPRSSSGWLRRRVHLPNSPGRGPCAKASRSASS